MTTKIEQFKNQVLSLTGSLDELISASPMPIVLEQAESVNTDALRDAVAEQLQGLYWCSRVWSAWSYGTMTENDFTPAEEVDDAIDNIVFAVSASMPKESTLLARIAHLEQEEECSEAVIKKFSTILADICLTLKGERTDGVHHSYHDLAHLVSVQKLASELYQFKVAELEAENQKLKEGK